MKTRPKQDTRQTARSGGGFMDKINAYRDMHAHALFSSLGRLVSTPFSSGITVIVLAIAISLASGFYLVVVNLQQLMGGLETSNQISLFLRDDISEHQAEKFAKTIGENPQIESVKLITKEQALSEFKAFSGFGDAINILEQNPLPIVIQVLPKNSLEDKASVEQLLEGFQHSAEVDFAQLDRQWVERLESIIAVAHLGVTLLSLLLGVAVLFIIGNTIRLELHNRRDEVIITKLIGATDSFIRRPFLYTGFWLGFISGVAAWFIVALLMLILKAPVEKLSKLYQGDFYVLFLSFSETVAVLFLSSALGIMGAWVVLYYQLKRLKTD